MKHFEQIVCPHCQGGDIVKNGKSPRGEQRYKCKSCKKAFLRNYKNKAYEPGCKERIEEQILNSSGVRDTARILGISKGTVINHLKKNVQKK